MGNDYYRFLSTLPVRGATMFNGKFGGGVKISIHAPREGSDVLVGCLRVESGYFYPRSP